MTGLLVFWFAVSALVSIVSWLDLGIVYDLDTDSDATKRACLFKVAKYASGAFLVLGSIIFFSAH